MKSLVFPVLAVMFLGALPSWSGGQDNEATAVAVASTPVQKMGPITVTVDLIGGQKISGTLTEVTQIPIRTAFGEATVPLAEVAGVKLATAEDTSTTIIMKNGDSITGATDLKVLSVDTEWGSAKINGSSVSSILLLPDLKWNASIGLNGKRWSLVDSKATTGASTSQPSNLLPGGTVGRPGPTGSSTNTPVLPNGARVISPG